MNKAFPEVSIIIVNFNGLNYLHDCFTSLMEIDYPKEQVEYILIDNGSTDGSVNYIEKRFPNVRILMNNQNRGFAGANNQGAIMAKGEILAFLNNDMKVHPLWLKKLVDKLRESSEDLACVSSKILNYEGDKFDFIGGGFTPFGISFQLHFGKSVKEIEFREQDKEKELLFGCGGAMAIKKNVFMESGGFDEDFFAYLEDVDLGWRLRLMGYRILYVPESIAFHKHRGTGKKIPAHQLEFMFERNRLFTIVKNTEDIYLPYFLSMVSILNIYRTFSSSMSNIKEFYFVSFGRERPFSDLQGSLKVMRSFGKKLNLVWKKRELGIILRWVIRKTNFLMKFIGYKVVPIRTLSSSAAFDSIIPELSSLIQKRKEIQANRKISDRQIFPLFLMDEYPKQAIARDSMLVIEKIIEFQKQIMMENRIRFPE